MSDSFFGFDTNLESDNLDEGLASDEEDEDYDALNDETFGEDVFSGDWEEDHEKLAELTELSRHGGKQENGDLSSQFASFLLDNESLPHKYENVENVKCKPRPPPGFWINNGQPYIKPPIPPIKSVCTVEELERNLIHLTQSLRLEDIERKLIPPKTNPPGLPGNLRVAPPFTNLAVQPPRQSIIGASIPTFPHFQMHPPLHLIMPPGLVGMPGGIGPLPHNAASPQAFLRRPHTTLGHNQSPLLPFNRHTPDDEYAGLMTNNEKQWLVSIQLVQLSTTTPFQDDYYYIMYQHRQSGHLGRKMGCPLKSKENQIRESLAKSSYTPLQFENSLGKLQVGSVTAPRKIIDTDIVENIECTASSSSSKKVKQILLEIEHMFSDVLIAEEALSPLATNTSDDINPNLLLSKAVNVLLKNDKLKTVLGIRKGKTLVLRVMSHHEVSSPLAHKLITILPFVAKRDTEQAMLRALPAIRHNLATVSLDSLVNLSTYLSADISFLLSNKLGISVITNMIERAEACMALTDSPGWISFVTDILSICPTIEIEKPVVGICGPTLSRHLSRCSSANNQHIAILQKALSNTVN